LFWYTCETTTFLLRDLDLSAEGLRERITDLINGAANSQAETWGLWYLFGEKGDRYRLEEKFHKKFHTIETWFWGPLEESRGGAHFYLLWRLDV
jgi:hypothetical protein